MLPHPVVRLSPSPPLGRRRTVNFDLPPRMGRKGLVYYWISSSKPRRWIALGSNLAVAKQKWAELESGPAPRLSVGEFLERFVAEHACSEGSRTQYRVLARILGSDLAVPVAELRASHVALWRDLHRHKPSWANQGLALLAVAWAKAREYGYTEADIRVRKLPVSPRERMMTDDEFISIRAAAVSWLRVAIDLAYLTAARPVDIRNLQWGAVADTVAIRQRKTGVRQAFTITAELRSVIDQARQRRVLGLYVVADDKGRQITKGRMERAWARAREAAGVADIQFRDIRAKSATEAQRRGQDYQKLLGHTTQRQSDAYVRSRRVEQVEPLKGKL